MTTIIDKQPAPAAPNHAADHAAHLIEISALSLALAKHFVMAADEAQATAFVDYFKAKSIEFAMQTRVPAVVRAVEVRVESLVGGLMAARRGAAR